MMGKRKPQGELFDVGNVYPLELSAKSFHGQLARVARELFHDEDFAGFYAKGKGRPSVPPSQLALLTLLQHEAGVSDEEAVLRSGYDLRWAAVLGEFAGQPLCAKSTFQLFRSHLLLHDQAQTLFVRSLEKAQEAGLLSGKALRLAIDTKPIWGRGAVEDTYNLVATGIQQLCQALARLDREKVKEWARRHDFGRYFASSIKGAASLDWTDPEARSGFLTGLVRDARRLLQWAQVRLSSLSKEQQKGVRAAAELLEQLLLQDLTESTTPAGQPQAAVAEGTASGRVPSATDPEQRHGRKSKSKRFTGHKASITVDEESQLVTSATVLAGDAPDATEALEQVKAAEANTGLPVAATLGDCAYGSGETREAFAQEQRPLLAKVPQARANGGRFAKEQFVIDLEAGTVTCPAGVVLEHYTQTESGERRYSFGRHCDACPLREQCTTAQKGRRITVHPQEGLLQEARRFQASEAGRQVLQKRVVVEHALARLAHRGIGQARYMGKKKTRFQLLLAATVVNLRRLWNWSARREADRLATSFCGGARLLTAFWRRFWWAWGAQPVFRRNPLRHSPGLLQAA